jgi:hypothetical protein
MANLHHRFTFSSLLSGGQTYTTVAQVFGWTSTTVV